MAAVMRLRPDARKIAMASSTVGLKTRSRSITFSLVSKYGASPRHTAIESRVAELVLDRDVRRIVDQPPDEILLRALHQRRHCQKERDPEHDARQRDEALPPAREQVLQRDAGHQTDHFCPAAGMARTCCPAFKFGEGAVTIQSPSLRP